MADSAKCPLTSALVFFRPDWTERKGLFSKRHARHDVALVLKKGETMPLGPQSGNAGLASEVNVDP